jgi:hypothetical protein
MTVIYKDTILFYIQVIVSMNRHSHALGTSGTVNVYTTRITGERKKTTVYLGHHLNVSYNRHLNG